MRFFVIIAACVGFASALPQGFSRAQAGTFSGPEEPVSIVRSPAVYEDAAGGDGSVLGFSDTFRGVNIDGGNYDVQTGAISTAVSGTGLGGTSSRAEAKTVVKYKAPITLKNFYYHVAPEDPRPTTETKTLTITPRKHYKVIFIKAPSVGADADSRAKAASSTEEKTIVYVLVNKPAQAKAGSVADASSFVSGKPEIYFVKYQNKNDIATSTSVSNSGNGNADAIAQAYTGAGGNTYADATANAYTGAGGNTYTAADASAGTRFTGNLGRTAGFTNAAANAGSNIELNNIRFGNNGVVSGANANAAAGAVNYF